MRVIPSRAEGEGPPSCRFDHTFDERASIKSRRVVHRGSGRRLAQWGGDYSWLASTVACVTQSPTGRSLGALRRPRDDTPSFRDVLKDANHVPSLEAKQKAAFSKTPGRFRNRPSLKGPATRAAALQFNTFARRDTSIRCRVPAGIPDIPHGYTGRRSGEVDNTRGESLETGTSKIRIVRSGNAYSCGPDPGRRRSLRRRSCPHAH